MTRVRSLWIREHLQVEHQLGVLLERRPECRPDARPAAARVALCCLGLLDAALDVANRVEVLGSACVRSPAPRLFCRRSTSVGHRVEDAAVLLDAREARRRRPCCRMSPNSRSKTARGLFSIGSGVVGGAPRDRVGVGAAVAGVARARAGRSTRGTSSSDASCVSLPSSLRDDLVDRHAGANVGALGLLRADAGEERAPTRARDRRRLRPAADRRLVGRARSARRSSIAERRPSGSRIGVSSKPAPSAFGVQYRHAPCRSARRRRRAAGRGVAAACAWCAKRRHHAVEQRQRQRRAQAAQERAARQMPSW